MLKPKVTSKPSDCQPGLSRLPDGNLQQDGQNLTPGIITCDVCGKILQQIQLYRGRCRCWNCAIIEHKRVLKHSAARRHGQDELDFQWDDIRTGNEDQAGTR